MVGTYHRVVNASFPVATLIAHSWHHENGAGFVTFNWSSYHIATAVRATSFGQGTNGLPRLSVLIISIGVDPQFARISTLR
jgi:hypothetical protein